MINYTAEALGTAMLILLGDGVVANVLLARSKGESSGWIVITFGWGVAVMVAVYAVGRISGAHLNPAVTVALAATGQFDWANVGTYVTAQIIGAMLGATLVWLHYLPHWRETADPGLKLAVFCTAPAIRSPLANLMSEAIATFALVLVGTAIVEKEVGSGYVAPMIGALVWGIGLGLGATTGYAINPARDLSPRLAHALLPIPGKGGSDWGYAWIPVAGPLIGAAAAGLLAQTVMLQR